MRSWAAREGCFSQDQLDLFDLITKQIREIPDFNPPERISCHILCHALARVHNLTAVDGHFGSRGSYHGWIDLGRGIILDAYPVGTSASFLVDTNGMLNPWNRMYIRDPKVFEKLDIEADICLIENELRRLR